MPIENYGVLKGKILEGKQERYDESPHYQILVRGEDNIKYRVAVNVMSQYGESEILYLAAEPYKYKNDHMLQKLPYGFTRITNSNKELGLDYIRQNVTNQYRKMVLMPHDKPGPKNDLNDFFNSYIQSASQSKDNIYVFGSKFGPEERTDHIFDFYPMQGIHNVHMNQGNEKRWKRDNGIWQDGGILIQKKEGWVGIFLAFLTQKWKTDKNGNPIE